MLTTAAPLTQKLASPWRDRAGRLSPLKLCVFLLLFVPAAWLAVQWRLDMLGSKPVTELIHQTGVWTVRFLLMSLAVTPLKFIGAWPKLFLVRRMLGLAALSYVVVHISLYVVQERYDVLKVVSEIALRFYLTIGFAAALGLAALGATSTDAMVRRLGETWHRLHRIVYALAVLALLHFFLQRKIDVTEAVMMAGFFLMLMGYRLMRRFGVGLTPAPLAIAAVFGVAVTMLLEYVWYGLATGVPPFAVFMANFDFSFTIRPSWWVGLAGLAMAALALLRQGPGRARSLRRAVIEQGA